ncbi:uncharacterized protein K460DRAFT_435543 [Cucurbitaria berberidis CBS 394.84]|uniref:C2H2-type domain-containing protein n=1 Tax=Cucurbitaria berberidis CBS 394.84 TaxID=1168544 RepID=A0A9P4L5C7_9PLEO|nr:uncharacterized protein K460DRAFT_435543 [Cucurbitaria berberidis CBS 394.84]KAF1842212.1 hypothetical protein K460DRAFT_435543 [Cucurbitaria berberidis CBS 394.84]
MFSFIRFIAIITLARCVCTGVQKNLESPFGLTFSPTAIIASRFNASGAVEVTRHPVSPEYQAYYDNAVHGDGSPIGTRYMNNATAMLYHAVVPVSESLRKQLGHSPEYRALFLPSVFDYNMWNAAIEAVAPNNPLDRFIKFGSFQQAACHGYGFLQGEHLGRAPEEHNNDDGPPNLILFLEYEKDYLFAWLLEVAFEYGTFPVAHQKICKECGDRFRENNGIQAHEKRVSAFLDSLIQEALQIYERDSIRAIVIAGEASSLGITNLSIMAYRAVGTQMVSVMTEIAPTDVVAHGAAVWARLVQQFPDNFVTESGNKIVEHDEL